MRFTVVTETALPLIAGTAHTVVPAFTAHAPFILERSLFEELAAHTQTRPQSNIAQMVHTLATRTRKYLRFVAKPALGQLLPRPERPTAVLARQGPADHLHQDGGRVLTSPARRLRVGRW